MAEYINLVPDGTEASEIEQDFYDLMRTRWPQWDPADGELETFLNKALSFRIAELNQTAVDVADEIFATYGAMRNIPRYSAAKATGTSTWTLIDDAGYTINAGTQVAIPISGNQSIAFEVAVKTVVAPGDTEKEVQLVASDTGSAGNDLTGDPSLIDALIFVESIELAEPTSGGADEELLATYLTRLKERLEVATETPIVPRDFEIIARTYFPFVSRAIARDGYNPDDDSTENERMISLAISDVDGEPNTTGEKNEVKALLESMREINFVVHLIDGNYTAIDVKYSFQTHPGYQAAVVRATADGMLGNYFKPSEWGRLQIAGSAAEFVYQPTVRYFEVISLLDRVPGIDFLNSVEIRKAGGSFGTTDLSLTGAVPLTRPGAFTAT